MAVNLLCAKCYTTRRLRVKKCSCGHTQVKFKVRVKTPEGKGLIKQVPTLSLAKKVELKFQSQSVLEGIGIYRAPVLDDVWKRYLKHARLQKNTWDADEVRWLHHIKPKLSSYLNLKMDKVTPGMMQDILDGMNKTHKTATRKQVLQLINRVYNWSIKQKLCHGTNPCQSVSIPKLDNRVAENLTPDEIERLIGVLAGDKNKRASLVVLFALYTGKRRAETLGAYLAGYRLGFRHSDLQRHQK